MNMKPTRTSRITIYEHSMAGLVLFLCCNLVARAVPPPSVQIPHSDQVPALSASFDDPSWNGAAKIVGLQLSENPPYNPTTVPQTTVLLKWDRDNLYVRFICEGDQEIYSPFSGRDAPYYKGDVVEVFLDPKGDGREYVEIEVSPNNGVLDQIYLCTAEPKYKANGRLEPAFIDRDLWTFPSWNLDGLRTAAANHGSKGWIVDMAIPASILKRTGTKEFGPMVLRANFLRYDYPVRPQADGSIGERVLVPLNWAPVQGGCPHISADRMGYLDLVEHPN